MNQPSVSCEKCGSQTEVFCDESTQGTRCKKCDWSVVTTHIPPIRLDRTVYEVRIEHGDSQNVEHIKAIANVAGVNFLKARDILKLSQPIVCRGYTPQVLAVCDTLRAVGVSTAITPEFPWSS